MPGTAVSHKRFTSSVPFSKEEIMVEENLETLGRAFPLGIELGHAVGYLLHRLGVNSPFEKRYIDPPERKKTLLKQLLCQDEEERAKPS